MIKKILVANRGEIAVRIMRACRELGIPSVAVYSDADVNSIFARYANEAFSIGPARASESYLNIKKIIEVAEQAGADAIHPGYGFLSQNPNFALACEQAGITFIGPSSKVLELMGNKVAARQEMKAAGIPTIPGTDYPVSDFDQIRHVVEEIGYPIIIKPSGGGGGIGMTVANNRQELEKALESTQVLAQSTFGLPDVYIEKYLPHPRHIEFQILADNHGNVIHLGERECSIQRRYQKLIEECPSPAVTPELRKEMGDIAVRSASHVNYRSAGTIEFLLQDGDFYFLEANTRIQVEHPVTEFVTGVDIVKEQIKIADNEPLSLTQDELVLNGWAIECRINAEDPHNNFAPSPGKLTHYRSPGGVGIRVDSGVHTSYTIPGIYDPMISKLIAWGRNRNEAIDRMKRALYEYIVMGVKTNISFHKAVLENPRFVSGELGTHFITQETTLLDDMVAIEEREKPLEEKLTQIFGEKKRVAAIAGVTQYLQSQSTLKKAKNEPD
ncbi:MAG: acetyl-CoA carboxylase biotin carboxylase subunit [Dehalococcoidales bacterium]|nr:acetyl-CoA carboxylase biotin carboxylase subunit [Dehalococcoidales bacterium]